ncbi:LysR family transcriptional regulator [Pseudomonas aeruginosa]|nr:LysR family transcriptional regulator [Pseudomonas aeruginosa]
MVYQSIADNHTLRTKKMQHMLEARVLTFSRFTRYFMEVARLGSLRRAAEVLHVSASAIDRQILLAEQKYRNGLV